MPATPRRTLETFSGPGSPPRPTAPGPAIARKTDPPKRVPFYPRAFGGFAFDKSPARGSFRLQQVQATPGPALRTTRNTKACSQVDTAQVAAHLFPPVQVR